MTKKVLDIGQCSFDHSQILQAFSSFNCEVAWAKTREEALSKIDNSSFDLLLINRIIDYDGSSGLDLIKTLKENATTQNNTIMLVSNFDDAQQQAVQLGALPGFGKSQLRSTQLQETLSELLKKPLEK